MTEEIDLDVLIKVITSNTGVKKVSKIDKPNEKGRWLIDPIIFPRHDGGTIAEEIYSVLSELEKKN